MPKGPGEYTIYLLLIDHYQMTRHFTQTCSDGYIWWCSALWWCVAPLSILKCVAVQPWQENLRQNSCDSLEIEHPVTCQHCRVQRWLVIPIWMWSNKCLYLQQCSLVPPYFLFCSVHISQSCMLFLFSSLLFSPLLLFLMHSFLALVVWKIFHQLSRYPSWSVLFWFGYGFSGIDKWKECWTAYNPSWRH